jgi:hypothetical protein
MKTTEENNKKLVLGSHQPEAIGMDRFQPRI